jgi:hypothetical protein
VHESVERYIRDLWEDYASGEAVPETSGYGALQNLLNDVGSELAPSVKAIDNIRNRGAGIPDAAFSRPTNCAGAGIQPTSSRAGRWGSRPSSPRAVLSR